MKRLLGHEPGGNMIKYLGDKLGFSKEETSWILYDVANSEFILMTTTVIFPLMMSYISKVQGSIYVGWANTIYALILALIAPVLGTIADYRGYKKKFFLLFLTLGLAGAFVLALPFINDFQAFLIYIVTMVGYGGANVFYDAFLVDVTSEARLNKISSAGYGWGYIGSVVPFLLFIIPFGAVTLFGGDLFSLPLGGFTLTYRLAMSISMALAALWWFGFSFPMLKNVKQRYYRPDEDHVIKKSFERLYNTFKNIQNQKNVFLFCLAYFFYIDVVNSVIKMAVALATDMGISPVASLGVIIVVQFVAFPSALLYGHLANRVGDKKMLFVGIFGYFVVVLVGSRLGHNPGLIWVLGFIVGLLQGGIQAISRSFFAKLIPDKKDSSEYFGFFSIFSKFSAILGPLSISIVVTVTKNPSQSILALIPLLVIGGSILVFVKEPENSEVQ